MLPSLTSARISASIRHGCYMVCYGAMMTVSSLTNGISIPITFKEKNMSRIALYFLLLGSTIVNSRNLGCIHSGVPRRWSISYKWTTFTCPSFTFPSTSVGIILIASNSNGHLWRRHSAAIPPPQLYLPLTTGFPHPPGIHSTRTSIIKVPRGALVLFPSGVWTDHRYLSYIQNYSAAWWLNLCQDVAMRPQCLSN